MLAVTAMTFTVTLSAASSQAVSVNYSTLPGTAVVAKDYLASSGSVTFAAGEVTKTIVIQIIGDTSRENTETLVVRLAGAIKQDLRSDATGAIVDDETAKGRLIPRAPSRPHTSSMGRPPGCPMGPSDRPPGPWTDSPQGRAGSKSPGS